MTSSEPVTSPKTVCPSSISVAVIKDPDKKQCRGERGYFAHSSRLQFVAVGRSRQELEAVGHIQSISDQGEGVHADCSADLCSAQFFSLCTVQTSCQKWCHSQSAGVPTSVNSLRQSPTEVLFLGDPRWHPVDYQS